MSDNIYLPKKVQIKLDNIQKKLDLNTRVKVVERLIWMFEEKEKNQKDE